MKSLKALSIIFAASGIMAVAVPAGGQVYASEINSELTKELTTENIKEFDSETLKALKNEAQRIYVESENGNQVVTQDIIGNSQTPEYRAGGTAAVKAAIRYMLKHFDDILDLADNFLEKDMINLLRKNADPVLDKLTDLLDYETLVFDNIEDLLASALIRVGVPSSAARTISWGLRQVAEWLL